jgi:tRNA(Arg) A34 adenosine deaminase TadA
MSSQTEGVVIDESHQRAPLTATPDQLKKMLLSIENDILPKTSVEVANGNKVFGAGILDRDFGTIFADTNTETSCPIFHGEVKTIFAWSQCTPAKDRGPIAQSSIFLSTHEPCCMCISSILWAGFNTVYYFFPYAITSAQGYVSRPFFCRSAVSI